MAMRQGVLGVNVQDRNTLNRTPPPASLTRRRAFNEAEPIDLCPLDRWLRRPQQQATLANLEIGVWVSNPEVRDHLTDVAG